jgi:cell division protein FtsB
MNRPAVTVALLVRSEYRLQAGEILLIRFSRLSVAKKIQTRVNAVLQTDETSRATT